MTYYYWVITTYKSNSPSLSETYYTEGAATKQARNTYSRFPFAIERVVVIKSTSKTDPEENSKIILSL